MLLLLSTTFSVYITKIICTKIKTKSLLRKLATSSENTLDLCTIVKMPRNQNIIDRKKETQSTEKNHIVKRWIKLCWLTFQKHRSPFVLANFYWFSKVTPRSYTLGKRLAKVSPATNHSAICVCFFYYLFILLFARNFL